MTTIAFIGLGVMGRPMARNVVQAAHDVVACNCSPVLIGAHVSNGGRAAGSVAGAVSGASVVITVLPDSLDV